MPCYLLLILVLFLYGPAASPSNAVPLPEELVHNGGYMASNGGKLLLQYRQDEMFRPASTIKLLTALSALDTLGENFRFKTSFYIDGQDRLYVKGGGDPFLTSEYLSQIVKELAAKGIRRISGYVLDDSLYDLEHSLPTGSENSTNPYDAPNGALAVNFNSISIIKQKSGTVGSGEGQTPTAQITLDIGRLLPPGNHRININHFPLPGKLSPQLRYTAELIHKLAEREGIETQLQVRRDLVPRSLEPIHIFESPRTLRENIEGCLHFSNNFIANQLALTAAAHRYGYPATWAKTKEFLNMYAREKLKIAEDSLRVEEGSGLSRKTEATPRALIRILESFSPYRELLPHRKGVLLKSGTMNSTYCYAGYMESAGTTTAFALLLNQKRNTRDRLLSALKKRVQSLHRQ